MTSIKEQLIAREKQLYSKCCRLHDLYTKSCEAYTGDRTVEIKWLDEDVISGIMDEMVKISTMADRTTKDRFPTWTANFQETLVRSLQKIEFLVAMSRIHHLIERNRGIPDNDNVANFKKHYARFLYGGDTEFNDVLFEGMYSNKNKLGWPFNFILAIIPETEENGFAFDGQAFMVRGVYKNEIGWMMIPEAFNYLPENDIMDLVRGLEPLPDVV